MLVQAGMPLPAAGASLTDVREAPEAHQAIVEMNLLGIISGYPNGLFKPRQKVTRMETIAMLIRLLGLEEQAKTREEEIVGYRLPGNLNWGRGYLLVGVDRGMLDGNYLYRLEPSAPVTRAEVAALVCLALELEPEAGSVGYDLYFTDVGQVPPAYRKYAAFVTKNDIMQRYPGNFFMPAAGIDRARMAMLLAKLLENNLCDPFPARCFTGTILSLDPDGRQMTFQADGPDGNGVDGNTSFIWTIAVDGAVFLDGEVAELSGLKTGDAVKLILDEYGQVVFIAR